MLAPGAARIIQFRAGNRHAVLAGDSDRLGIAGLVEEFLAAIGQVMREIAGAVLGRRARNDDLARIERKNRLDRGFAHEFETTQRILVCADFRTARGKIVNLRDHLVAHIGLLEVFLCRARIAAFTAAIQRADIGLDGKPERLPVLQR